MPQAFVGWVVFMLCCCQLKWPMHSMDPDAALMLRVKRGDIKAFEELAEKYKTAHRQPDVPDVAGSG